MVKSKVTGTVLSHKEDFYNDIKILIREILEKEIIPEIKREIDRLLKKTTRNWDGGIEGSQSDRTYYPPPNSFYDKTDIEITANSNGIKLEFDIKWTAKAEGGPSKLWYILDFGRPGGTWDEGYSSAWYLPQSVTRSQPNTLEVSSSRDYFYTDAPDGWLSGTGRVKAEDGLIYVRKFPGDQWAGIEPRNWSKLIAEEIQRKYSKDFTVKFTRKDPS